MYGTTFRWDWRHVLIYHAIQNRRQHWPLLLFSPSSLFSLSCSGLWVWSSGGLTVPGPHNGPGVSIGSVPSVQARSPSAMASSAACCRFNATCAAMTRCRSAIRLHLGQSQSLNRQWRLWPLSQETMPWFRHRAHLGFRAPFSVSGYSGVGSLPEGNICIICMLPDFWLSVISKVQLTIFSSLRCFSQRQLGASHFAHKSVVQMWCFAPSGSVQMKYCPAPAIYDLYQGKWIGK